MNQAGPRTLTLFDLLGRVWHCGAPAGALCFGGDGAAVAFACADGTVAVAAIEDPEPPETRIRISGDVGQATIRPRARPPAPLAISPSLHDGAPPIAAGDGGGFLAGTRDGEIVVLGADGALRGTRARIDGPVIALDHAAAVAITAVAGSDAVQLCQGVGALSDELADDGEGEIVGIRLSPSGRHLAIARSESLSIVAIDGSGRAPMVFGLLSRPLSLAWREDEAWLACTLAEGGFLMIDCEGGRSGTVTGFPMATRDAAWSGPAAAFVASGAFRVAAWSMATPPLDGDMTGALVSGRAGLVAVESVAAHPARPLVAAGYANGQILLVQIGGRDELLVRPGGSAVTALGWSADGHHLAAIGADGMVSITAFPDRMFK
ncbi:WD40 repeat domain-containing protein [Acidiphilium sp.]|uniref:WD40 repeat domain-containing protein n=1 Tax=Acidiphilium sp. TaxID=527 RepID=UPI00258878A2|nr:hypothetical protein [Acidiphilium sp.]